MPWKMWELSPFIKNFLLITNLKKKRSHGADLTLLLMELVFSEFPFSNYNKFKMSHSSSLPDHSPDESGYYTSTPRRNQPVQEESDLSEESGAATQGPSTESSVRAPPPVDVAGPSCGPRTIWTAQKRVLPVRRVIFTVSSNPSGEPAGSRSRL